MVPAGLRWRPHGRGGVRCGLERGFPRRGCRRHRAARTHLTSSSFRAFRFATRSPGARRGRCPHRPVAEVPSTTGQRQRKEKLDVSQTSPGWRFPQGQRVSVPDCRAGQPTIPRRRQEVCACADRPAEHFFFSTGRGAFVSGLSAALRAVGLRHALASAAPRGRL